MYYAESLALISQTPLDRQVVLKLDRELAHTFAPGGYGHLDISEVSYKTFETVAAITGLLKTYETLGVISIYHPVRCSCGELYNSQSCSCPDCGRPSTQATRTKFSHIRIIKQPQQPAYNPLTQPADPDVFISYRRHDSEILATDIYYRLQQEGKKVFLDNGQIPQGANAESTFLRAASVAPYFVALVSPQYFESTFCKKELAHALRCGRRLLRVNVDSIASSPPDMPWINTPNWISEMGSSNGLSPTLEQILLSAIQTQPGAPIIDLRLEACIYLIDQLGPAQLASLWNRLPWMRDYNFSSASNRQQHMEWISRETTTERIPLLCNTLGV